MASATRMRMRERALPEWEETPSAPRAPACSTRPAERRPSFYVKGKFEEETLAGPSVQNLPMVLKKSA